METAYNYYGRNSRDKEVKGVIFAESPEIAKKQLESMGINVLSYPTLNLWATLQGIGQDGFDKRSLLRFYATMGRGIERGRNVSTVLSESAEASCIFGFFCSSERPGVVKGDAGSRVC